MPPTQGLNRQRYKGNTLGPTSIESGTHLPFPSVFECIARVRGLLIDDSNLKGGNDSDVKGCVATPLPVPKENVCWASCRAWDKAAEFSSRSKVGFLGCSEENIAEVIVAGYSLAIYGASNGMVAVFVTRPTAGWTRSIFFEDRGSR